MVIWKKTKKNNDLFQHVRCLVPRCQITIGPFKECYKMLSGKRGGRFWLGAVLAWKLPPAPALPSVLRAQMAFQIPPGKAAKNGINWSSNDCVSLAHSGPLHILPHLIPAMSHYAILQIEKLRPRVVKSLAGGHTASTWKSCITLRESSRSFSDMHEGVMVCLRPLASAWVQGHLLDVTLGKSPHLFPHLWPGAMTVDSPPGGCWEGWVAQGSAGYTAGATMVIIITTAAIARIRDGLHLLPPPVPALPVLPPCLHVIRGRGATSLASFSSNSSVVILVSLSTPDS